MSHALMFIHCLSPLHAGVGQGVDVVDLAIARERGTGFPYLPGSSIKGSLRDRAHQARHDWTTRLFGPDTANASDHSGAVAFGDGNLLLLPVRSVAGTFAWVTSPYLLQRLNRDLRAAGLKQLPGVPAVDAVKEVVLTGASRLKVSDRVYFEDLDFKPARENSDELARAIAQLLDLDDNEQPMFLSRFCVVHDDVMSFLCRHATDVITRVSLEPDSKTAKKGQLWTEENLPAESVLVALAAHVQLGNGGALSPDAAFEHLRELTRSEVQFGGKATVGRGRCRVSLARGGAQ